MVCNGDKFIDDMFGILPIDIITYIIQKFIYLPENLELIRYQKKLRQLMHRQLNIISNIIHIDDNCCVYTDNNYIVICNNIDARLIAPQQYITDITYNMNIPNINNIHESILNLMSEEQVHHATPARTDNQALLAQINSNLEVISRSSSLTSLTLPSLYTSNMVIQTTHEDMDNVIFYILYA